MEFGSGVYSDHCLKEFEEVFRKHENHSLVSDLQGLKKTKKVYLGLPQWGVSEWKGSFYPKTCPPQRFLGEYARHLSCVEVSSTFYSDVSPTTISKWTEAVPEDFRFLPKWPQQITHGSQLKNCQKQISNFLGRLEAFGEKLGVSILQLPPGFSTEYRMELFHFLELLPDNFPVAIELRHRSWFSENRLYMKFEEYLCRRGFGTVCSDTPARRDVFHLSFSGSNNVIRYLSDRRADIDRLRLNLWRNFLSQVNIESIYLTLHRPDNERSPELIALFDDKRALSIKEAIAGPQVSLF